MRNRRNFMRLAGAAAPAAAIALNGEAKAADNNVNDLLGAWTTLHDSPYGKFRELLMFAEGGGLTETNSLLHTRSNIDFSFFGLPSAVNGSDGMGSWLRMGPGQIRVGFRKLLFDGSGVHFGDFWVKGTVSLNAGTLSAIWDQIWIVNKSDQLLANFTIGPPDFQLARSEGTRIF